MDALSRMLRFLLNQGFTREDIAEGLAANGYSGLRWCVFEDEPGDWVVLDMQTDRDTKPKSTNFGLPGNTRNGKLIGHLLNKLLPFARRKGREVELSKTGSSKGEPFTVTVEIWPISSEGKSVVYKWSNMLDMLAHIDYERETALSLHLASEIEDMNRKWAHHQANFTRGQK